MPHVARIIGGAGTGKTTFLMEKMARAMEKGGYTPFDVGFVSFTRAARQEAADRACERFGVDPDELARGGWFRTLHAICYRQLRVSGDTLLTDTKESREWLANAIGEEVHGIEGDESNPFAGRTEAETALSLWHASRNRLTPFGVVHDVAWQCDERTPSIDRCRSIVDKYEQAKRLDGREDYTDLLARFAGWRCDFEGCRTGIPQGDVPDIPVWFLDEQQDTSPLLDSVCKRLVGRSRWVYMGLDPFQSIYGWSGADYRCAMAWEAQVEHTLDQTYRCPAPVQSLGERVLSRASDYWDRKIRPAEHGGEVSEIPYGSCWAGDINPNESWLLLARTNWVARRLSERLDEHSIPWLPTSSNGRYSKWNAPEKSKSIRAMLELQDGRVITAAEWGAVLKKITKAGLFARGTKAKFASGEGIDPHELADLSTLGAWGATEEFCQRVRSRKWHTLIDGSTEFCEAWSRYGHAAVLSPKIRVGTIHSAKGAEADNVLLFCTTSHQVHRGMEIEQIANEERRVQYVGVTRARRRLLIAREGAPFEMGVGSEAD